MSQTLKYLVIHCSATPEGRNVQPEDIVNWHKGADDLPDGRVRYLWKKYTNRAALPAGILPGSNVEIRKSNGRGWRQVGYSDLILLDGSRHKFVDHDGDGLVDPDEITNGASGINAVSRHVCYVGGMTKDAKKAKNTITEAQIKTLQDIICEVIEEQPNVLIAGHNQFANKACPSFFVPKFLENLSIFIPEENIYKNDPFRYGGL